MTPQGVMNVTSAGSLGPRGTPWGPGGGGSSSSPPPLGPPPSPSSLSPPSPPSSPPQWIDMLSTLSESTSSPWSLRAGSS
eukprot:4788724-Pyramimonas_sp.AAC.1